MNPSTPKVQYSYDLSHGGRLTNITYPNGRVISYTYGSSGVSPQISRLESISDTGGTLESYVYLGLDTMVQRVRPQTNVNLTYIAIGSGSGDAGDQYTGLDRFGRVVDQRWCTPDGYTVERYGYGYDRDSNMLYQENRIYSVPSQLLTYDALNRGNQKQDGDQF